MNSKKMAISVLLVFTILCSCLIFAQDNFSLSKVLNSFAAMYAPNGAIPGNKASICFGEERISITNHLLNTKVQYFK